MARIIILLFIFLLIVTLSYYIVKLISLNKQEKRKSRYNQDRYYSENFTEIKDVEEEK